MKRIWMVITLLVAMLALVGCSSDETSEKTFVSEGEIVAVHMENRPLTNNYGGVKKHVPYISYCYVQEDGTIGVREHRLFDDYAEYNYEVILMPLGEENKVVLYRQGEKEIFEIYLTQETYREIFVEDFASIEEDVN